MNTKKKRNGSQKKKFAKKKKNSQNKKKKFAKQKKWVTIDAGIEVFVILFISAISSKSFKTAACTKKKKKKWGKKRIKTLQNY